MARDQTPITPQSILSTIEKISKETGLGSFVLCGSSSTIVFNQHRLRSLPDFMRKTMDVDISTTFRGQSLEIHELEMKALALIHEKFGENSPFQKENDYSVELVHRGIIGMTPKGWEERAKTITTEGGTIILILNPIDCAALKLEVGREKDIEWLAQGFTAKLFLPYQLEKHVKGHARYKVSEKKIEEGFAAAVKRAKALTLEGILEI
jgi:hypothetical protein